MPLLYHLCHHHFQRFLNKFKLPFVIVGQKFGQKFSQDGQTGQVVGSTFSALGHSDVCPSSESTKRRKTAKILGRDASFSFIPTNLSTCFKSEIPWRSIFDECLCRWKAGSVVFLALSNITLFLKTMETEYSCSVGFSLINFWDTNIEISTILCKQPQLCSLLMAALVVELWKKGLVEAHFYTFSSFTSPSILRQILASEIVLRPSS